MQKSLSYFSTLDTVNEYGNVETFEPLCGRRFSEADTYIMLLKELITYVNTRYPQYAAYTELINLLGHEFDLKEASCIMGKPVSTLAGWLKRLRPIYDEFMENVDMM